MESGWTERYEVRRIPIGRELPSWGVYSLTDDGQRVAYQTVCLCYSEAVAYQIAHCLAPISEIDQTSDTDD